MLNSTSLSHLCAQYLRLLFLFKLNSRLSGVPAAMLTYPLLLPVALASELNEISATLVDAFVNRSQ